MGLDILVSAVPVVVGEFDLGDRLSAILNLTWEILRSCLVRIIISAGITSAIISIALVNVAISSVLCVTSVPMVVVLGAPAVVLLHDLDPLFLLDCSILVDNDLLF